MRMQLNVYLLALGAFLTAVAELVVSGILNAIAEDLGVTIALAGQLITAYSLAFAVGTPLVIALTSRLSRKRVLTGAMAFFILGNALSYVSTSFSFLVVSRMLLGLSAGAFLVVALSSVAKLVPSGQIGKAMSMIALGFSLAIVLGVPIGITIASRFDWHAIFLIIGGVSLLILLGILRFFPSLDGDAPIPFRQQLAVLKNPVIVSGLLMSILWSTGNSVMFTYLTPFLDEIYRLSASEIGMVMLGLGLFGVLGSRLGGYGVDRWGTVRMLTLTLAVSVASFALLPLAGSAFFVGIGLIVFWMTSMFVSAPALNTYYVQQAPQSANLVLSLNSSFTHLGLAIGAGAGGIWIDSGSSVLYNPWLASLVIGGGFVMSRFSFNRGRRGGISLESRS